jgi:hypothetical protein
VKTIDSASYQASFRLLTQDLEDTLEYVEPVDANEHVYSHRLYALYLRACTDFESLCREQLVILGSNVAPDKMKMPHYRRLEPALKLEPVSVYALFWRPEPRVLHPFKNWLRESPQWYADHHAVKHNRQARFPAASLSNVVAATAGLFAALAKVDRSAFPSSSYGRGPTHYSFSSGHFVMQWPVAV